VQSFVIKNFTKEFCLLESDESFCGVSRELPDWFVEKLKSISAKRAKTVISHILKHGFVTSQELKEVYGYNHPPRAARDVRELGVPLRTIRVSGSDGRSIAAYEFGDPSQMDASKSRGRKALSKRLRELLVEANGSRCGICLADYEPRYLQIDHRVP
jgi:hypothetical protein